MEQTVEETKNGGEKGIRTLGKVAPTQHFQCCAFDHSAISPLRISLIYHPFLKMQANFVNFFKKNLKNAQIMVYYAY